MGDPQTTRLNLKGLRDLALGIFMATISYECLPHGTATLIVFAGGITIGLTIARLAMEGLYVEK